MLSDNFPIWLGVSGFAAICLFILSLLARFKFRREMQTVERSNTPTGATLRSLLWTLAPVAVFAVAVLPGMWLAHVQNATPATDVTITMTGKMWQWTYKYSDFGNFGFDAPMFSVADSHGKQPSGYDHIVVPVGKTIRIVAAGRNVVYSWSIPALGAEIQALPGRTNQSWFKAREEGRYFGQCLELCGLPHTFAPIQVEVVSVERFEQWIAAGKARRLIGAPFASRDGG